LLPIDGKPCPAESVLDVDDAPLVAVVVELRIDCSSCCMIEELLRLETLKTVSPMTLNGAPGAAGATPNLSARSRSCEKHALFQVVTTSIQCPDLPIQGWRWKPSPSRAGRRPSRQNTQSLASETPGPRLTPI
jgi:hypothetical protein